MSLDYPQVTVSHIKACSSSSTFCQRPFLMPQQPSQSTHKHSPEAAFRHSPQTKEKWESWINIQFLSYRRIFLRDMLLRKSQKNQGLVSYNNLDNNSLILDFPPSLPLPHSCFLGSLPKQSTHVLFSSFTLRETQTERETFILRLNQDTPSFLPKPKRTSLPAVLGKPIETSQESEKWFEVRFKARVLTQESIILNSCSERALWVP